MKKIVYLLLLGLAGCQQEGVITEVPKDDWSVVANTAGQVKGQVNIKFKELPEDLQIVTTRSGVDTDNGQLNFVIRQLGGTRLERVFPHAGKFEARTRKAGLHLWYQVSFDENIPTAEAMKALSELPNVSIVEPIYKGKTERYRYLIMTRICPDNGISIMTAATGCWQVQTSAFWMPGRLKKESRK